MTSASQVHRAMRGEVCLGTKQSGAFQHRAAVNHQLRWPFARGDGELPLLKAGKNAILDPKPPESGECRIKCAYNARSKFAIGHGVSRLVAASRGAARSQIVAMEK
jgi:hypothetical protein